MSDNIGVFKLVELFTPRLLYREEANELFDMFIGYDTIIVDFKDIESINYSWTHQYVRNEYTVDLTIERANVPKSIMPMFAIVNNRMNVDGEFEFIDTLKRNGDFVNLEIHLDAVGHDFVDELVDLGH